MAALLGNAAIVQDDDVVGVSQGGDAVGDEDGSAVSHELAQVSENGFFSLGIHCRERVVQDQDAGQANQGAGQGGALLLAPGEGDAAFADQGVETAFEILDISFNLGLFGGCQDLFLASLVGAVGYIGTDSIGK